MNRFFFPKSGLWQGVSVFFSARMLIIFFLGFSSGLPLVLSGSSLAIRVKDAGGSLETIGLYALIGLPYTLKFIWAPLLDAWRAPLLSRFLGHRRGWLIFSQLALCGAVFFLGSLDPIHMPLAVACGASVVAFASATQDIVIDAFRVETLETREQAAGTAYFTLSYRVGMLMGGAGLIFFVAWLKTNGTSLNDAWFYGYAAMSLLIAPGIVTTLIATEPPRATGEEAQHAAKTPPLPRLVRNVRDSFGDFLSKPHSQRILMFVLLYKLCDALAGKMLAPFILDVGFSMTSYASIVKGVGFLASLVGSFAGGFIARIISLEKALLTAGVLQTISNLGFIVQSWVGADHLVLSLVIMVENFSAAVGTVIFVAYLSALCQNPLYTATHFALLTAAASSGRVILSSVSGFLAAAFGWPLFFAVTSLTAIPSLLLFFSLGRAGHFAALAQEEDAKRIDNQEKCSATEMKRNTVE